MLTAEKVAFEEPALLQLGRAAGGSLRDSLSLTDQAIAHGGGKVTAANVADMLGSLGNDLLWPLLERIVAGDGPGVIAEVPGLTFQFVPLTGFSTAANSKVPHNALHDARALRDHVLAME